MHNAYIAVQWSLDELDEFEECEVGADRVELIATCGSGAGMDPPTGNKRVEDMTQKRHRGFDCDCQFATRRATTVLMKVPTSPNSHVSPLRER